MATLQIKNKEAGPLLVALGIDTEGDGYELEGTVLTIPTVAQSDADAAYTALDKKAIADKIDLAEKHKSDREKDITDAKTDTDKTPAGLARRIGRIERILDLK